MKRNIVKHRETHAGFSIVLFPVSAKNQISLPFVLFTCKATHSQDTCKDQYINELKKVACFLQKELAAKLCVMLYTPTPLHIQSYPAGYHTVSVA